MASPNETPIMQQRRVGTAQKSFHVPSLTAHPMENSVSLASNNEINTASATPIDDAVTPNNPLHADSHSSNPGTAIHHATSMQAPPSGSASGRTGTSGGPGSAGKRLGGSTAKRPPTRTRLAGLQETEVPPSRGGMPGSSLARLSSAAGTDGKKRPGSASRTDVGAFDRLFSDSSVPPATSKAPSGESAAPSSALKAYNSQSYNMSNFTSSAAMALRSKQEHRSRQIQKEATNVYDTYERQRKAFQNASQLTNEMKMKMDDIAENQQLYGNANNVDHGQLASEIQEQLQEHENRNANGNHDASASEAPEGNLEVGVSENEAEVLEAQMRAKSKKIQKLRAMQRTLIGMDEAEEEERRRQLLGTNRGRIAGTGVSGSHSAAAANVHKTTAREVREVFEGMFNEKHSNDLPPEPPTVFTTTALGSAIEYMTESLSTIIDATDVICVTATFKGKDESATITPAVQALQKHIPYVQRCYAVALSHLNHFEAGEKAVLEGGSAEVNSLREQFLKRKEELTTEEQKEQTTLELLNGLKTRLLNQQRRVDLYEKMLALSDAYAAGEVHAGRDLQEDSTWSITVPTYYYVNPRRRSGARSCSASLRSLSSQQQRLADNDSPFPQGEVEAMGQGGMTGSARSRNASRNYNAVGVRFSSAVTPVPVNLSANPTSSVVNNNNNSNDNSTNNTAKSAAHTFLGQFLNPSAGGDGKQLATSVEDRIASTWGNPYLKGQRASSTSTSEGDGNPPPANEPPLTTEVAALLPLSKEERHRNGSEQELSEGRASVATSTSTSTTAQREGRPRSGANKTGGSGPTEEEVFIQERTVILLQALLGQLNTANANAESADTEAAPNKPAAAPRLSTSTMEEVAARKMTRMSVQRLLRFLLSIKKTPAA